MGGTNLYQNKEISHADWQKTKQRPISSRASLGVHAKGSDALAQSNDTFAGNMRSHFKEDKQKGRWH